MIKKCVIVALIIANLCLSVYAADPETYIYHVEEDYDTFNKKSEHDVQANGLLGYVTFDEEWSFSVRDMAENYDGGWPVKEGSTQAYNPSAEDLHISKESLEYILKTYEDPYLYALNIYNTSRSVDYFYSLQLGKYTYRGYVLMEKSEFDDHFNYSDIFYVHFTGSGLYAEVNEEYCSAYFLKTSSDSKYMVEFLSNYDIEASCENPWENVSELWPDWTSEESGASGPSANEFYGYVMTGEYVKDIDFHPAFLGECAIYKLRLVRQEEIDEFGSDEVYAIFEKEYYESNISSDKCYRVWMEDSGYKIDGVTVYTAAQTLALDYKGSILVEWYAADVVWLNDTEDEDDASEEVSSESAGSQSGQDSDEANGESDFKSLYVVVGVILCAGAAEAFWIHQKKRGGK